jgi:hypothetical protein
MANLKIRVFKRGESEPDTTVTIPGNILKIASKLISKRQPKNDPLRQLNFDPPVI